MKIFISQPMNGKTDEEILSERDRIIEKLTNIFDDFELIDSFIENAPKDATPLWYLGKSIELLSQADLVYFAKGWQNMRGCRIEHVCATEYGIRIMVE